MSSSKISFGAFFLNVTFAFSLKIQNFKYFFALVIYFHLDLNNDGHLSFKDLLWAKDKICFMSGWKIGTDKYKETEALFKSIWATLEVLADLDQDGKITKDEWV